VRFIKLGDADATQSATLMTHLGDTIACSFGNKIRCRGAAVAQRLSGEKKKINEIERPRVCSPPRATSLKKHGSGACPTKKLQILIYFTNIFTHAQTENISTKVCRKCQY
jgi:hypothetical protein